MASDDIMNDKTYIEELRQQIAELKQENGRLLSTLATRSVWLSESEAQEKSLEQQLAQARALLQETLPAIDEHWGMRPLLDKIRAFLAQGGNDGK